LRFLSTTKSTLVQTSFSSLIHQTISPFLMFDIIWKPFSIEAIFKSNIPAFHQTLLPSFLFHLPDININMNYSQAMYYPVKLDVLFLYLYYFISWSSSITAFSIAIDQYFC